MLIAESKTEIQVMRAIIAARSQNTDFNINCRVTKLVAITKTRHSPECTEQF